MSFTPCLTAFGRIGNFWAGTVSGAGLQLLPLELVWVPYNLGRVSESGAAPFLLLNTYTPDCDDSHPDDRRASTHDGIWCANLDMLKEESANLGESEVREALLADLESDKCFVLCINWWQSIEPSTVTGVCEHLFPHEVGGADAIFIVGLAVMRGRTVMRYIPNITSWDALLAELSTELREKISPPSPISFEPAFQSSSMRVKLPTIDYSIFKVTGFKQHCGCGPGLLCGVEYDGGDDAILNKFAWLPAGDVDAAATHVAANFLYMPSELMHHPMVAEQLGRMYWERDFLIGHNDLIPSLRPIPGGIQKSKIRRLVYVVDTQLVPMMVAAKHNIFTLGGIEDVDGVIRRLRPPSFNQVFGTLRWFYDASKGDDLADISKAQVQQAMESAALRKTVGLRFLQFEFFCTPEYFLALDVSKHVEWLGDDRLTLITGSDFDMAKFAPNCLGLQWTMDANRAGKRGWAAINYQTVYNRAQDDARPNPKISYVSHCLETQQVKVGLAVAQLNSAFKHMPESAQLPQAPTDMLSGRCKWCPAAGAWVPRSQPDAPRLVVRQAFSAHPNWQWWG